MRSKLEFSFSRFSNPYNIPRESLLLPLPSPAKYRDNAVPCMHTARHGQTNERTIVPPTPAHLSCHGCRRSKFWEEWVSASTHPLRVLFPYSLYLCCRSLCSPVGHGHFFCFTEDVRRRGSSRRLRLFCRLWLTVLLLTYLLEIAFQDSAAVFRLTTCFSDVTVQLILYRSFWVLMGARLPVSITTRLRFGNAC